MSKNPHGAVHRLLRVLLCLILLCVLLCLGILGYICWREKHLPPLEDYDAIVVLGAQVKADGSLSVQLQWRLDKAYEVWQKQPCLVTLCGAQGGNEPVTEAEAMRDYLLAKGIPEEDLLLDDSSYTTRQNLRNAAALLRERNVSKVLIVTSSYHLPRALALAEDNGLTASGVGSPTKPEYWLKNYGRETLSWVKYLLQRYLHLPLESE